MRIKDTDLLLFCQRHGLSQNQNNYSDYELSKMKGRSLRENREKYKKKKGERNYGTY